MTAEPSPALTAGVCPLCAAEISPADERCGSCGYTLAGVDGRPSAFSRPALWWSIAVLGAVYLVTLAVVAMTR